MHKDLLCFPSHLLLRTAFIKTFPFRDLCPRNRRYIQTASTTGARGIVTSSTFLNGAENSLHQAKTLWTLPCFLYTNNTLVFGVHHVSTTVWHMSQKRAGEEVTKSKQAFGRPHSTFQQSEEQNSWCISVLRDVQLVPASIPPPTHVGTQHSLWKVTSTRDSLLYKWQKGNSAAV